MSGDNVFTSEKGRDVLRLSSMESWKEYLQLIVVCSAIIEKSLFTRAVGVLLRHAKDAEVLRISLVSSYDLSRLGAFKYGPRFSYIKKLGKP